MTNKHILPRNPKSLHFSQTVNRISRNPHPIFYARAFLTHPTLGTLDLRMVNCDVVEILARRGWRVGGTLPL